MKARCLFPLTEWVLALSFLSEAHPDCCPRIRLRSSDRPRGVIAALGARKRNGGAMKPIKEYPPRMDPEGDAHA
jgi:hypothetical protein